MDANHYSELITLSQEIYDQATENLTNYLSAKYCAVGNDTMEQQMEDYLFVTEEFRNLDCRGCVTAASALSRLTSEPMKFLPPAVIGSSPSAFFLGNALALLSPDSQEEAIETFVTHLRRVIKHQMNSAGSNIPPS